MYDNAAAAEMFRTNPAMFEQAQAGLQGVLRRSATDADFRRKLIETPREALSEFHGHEMPATLNIKFIQNHAAMTIVLPPAVDAAAELTEADLETVAGGMSPAAVVTATWIPSLNVAATVLSVIASVTYWINDT
jgi:hypothetical protein